MTHRHDWTNKNASVSKPSSGKRKDFIFQSLWHKITNNETKKQKYLARNQNNQITYKIKQEEGLNKCQGI